MKIIKEDNKQFLKKDSERDLFTHHKKYLGTEVPEGYFLKSKNQMKKGGGIDINELNMPVIRTQFEEEDFEFEEISLNTPPKSKLSDVKINIKVMISSTQKKLDDDQHTRAESIYEMDPT